MADLTLGITLKADGSGFVGEVKVGQEALDKLGKEGQRAGREATRGLDAMGGALGRVKGLVISAIGAYAGFSGVQRLLSAVTREVTAAERATANLNAVLRATGGTVGITAEELSELADQLEAATLFDDAEIKQAEAVLLTFRQVQGDTFREAISLATDLAALMGGDLQSAVLQLGKALEDPETGLTALRRSGISFTKDQQELIKSLVETGDRAQAMQIILDQVAGQIGGVATEQVDGLTGGLNALDDALGDFQKSLANFKYGGSTILEQTVSLLERMADATNRLSDGPSPLEAVQGQISALQAERADLTAQAAARTRDPVLDWMSDLLGQTRADNSSRIAAINEQLRQLEDSAAFMRAAGQIGGTPQATITPTPIPGDAPGESDAAKKIRETIEALQFEEAQLSRTNEEQAIYNALKAAGATRDSEAGQQIEALVTSILRQSEANELVTAAQDAANATMEEGRALMEQLRTPAEVYADTIEHLGDLLAQGAIDQETFNRAVELADETLAEASETTDKWKDGWQAVGAVSTEALADILVEARTVGDVLDGLWKQILQIASQQLFAGPVNDLFGGIADSIFSGLGGSAGGGPNTNVTRSAKGNVFMGPAITEIAEAGRPEAALPLERLSNGDLGVRASGVGGGAQVEVNIYTQGGQQVRQERRRGADGREILDLFISALNGDLRDNGSFARTLSSTFGLQRR